MAVMASAAKIEIAFMTFSLVHFLPCTLRATASIGLRSLSMHAMVQKGPEEMERASTFLITLPKKIPDAEKGWPAPNRVRWFRTFAMNVSQIYDGYGEPVELDIEIENAPNESGRQLRRPELGDDGAKIHDRCRVDPRSNSETIYRDSALG
jgi:hypothetical protein